MKLAGLLVVAVCLGTCSAGFFSRLSDTQAAIRNTATSQVNFAKSTVQSATNVAKSTAASATNVAKSTVTTATNVAKTSVNMAATTTSNVVKAASTAGLNAGLSVMIATVRQAASATGNRNIAIPDINTKVGPLKFNATGGYFRDISTISQAGKANVSMNGTSILIDVPLKLDAIETGYEKFVASVWPLQVGGGVKVNIAEDSFVVHLRLTPGFNCALNVEKVDVAVFGGITLDFHDMNKAGEFALEKCSNMIIKFMKENIKKQVQSAIDTTLRNTLKENGSICSKFLG